ncbi:hypothetical protein B0H16DRAFT_1735435 [Mycena metata]|uniref:FAD-binding domain-containing protein n=1 Tax=Mycena metata TaxID=1033252 RepID=A0AAD7HS32_9AGAR|nr:hypothetical protein B0H16DRAFT_1735435 [Mycena metata]
MSSTNCKFRVAVVGCGISGLSLAAFISKFADKDPECRIAIDIYEAKPEVSTIGAGVGIWKRTWQALQDLDGFREDVVAKGFKVPIDGQSQGPIFRKSNQPTEGYDFHNHMMPYGPLGLHRPTLLEILQSKLSSDCQIHTSKKLGGYVVLQDGSIELTFSDGSTATADILVGADGVHSAARGAMFKSLGDGYEQYIQPIFSGRIAYRGVIPKAKFAETFPAHSALDHPEAPLNPVAKYCGKSMHVIAHPIGPIIGMNFFISRPEMEGKPYSEPMITEVTKEHVAGLFADWEPDVRSLAENVESYAGWAIHVVNPLPLCASGPAVLIGDAASRAHAMTPHQGMGGGQAIEDAHMLGCLLAHSSAVKANIPAVLKLYQELRLIPAQDAAEKSRLNGMMYEFNHPDFLFDEPSREELTALGEAIGRSFEWLAEGNVAGDWAEAEAQLRML